VGAARVSPRRNALPPSRAIPRCKSPIVRGPWLAWNEGLIELPPGAELLAYDHVGPQAFSIRGHLGVQFHPEVKPETTSRERLASVAASARLLSAFIESAQRRTR
jgi:GMP synthase-like glutamine amidotransferase